MTTESGFKPELQSPSPAESVRGRRCFMNAIAPRFHGESTGGPSSSLPSRPGSQSFLRRSLGPGS
jgi:hypothetical protein